MKMQRIYMFLFLLLSVLNTMAENNNNNSIITTTQSIPMIGAGYAVYFDAYLSPLEYSGYNFQYQNEWWKPFQDSTKPLSHLVKLRLNGGQLVNSAKSNVMLFGNIDVAWGIHYHYAALPNVTLLLGGMCDFNLAGKMVGRNVNNPGSADFATRLHLSAGLQYNFNILKQNFRLRYMLQTPLAGCMFVPELGASYYEMFELWHLKNAFHFSSPHNMLAVNQSLFLDMRFGRSTWRIGVEHDVQHWGANGLSLSRNSMNALIGTVIDIAYWGGRSKREVSTYSTIW